MRVAITHYSLSQAFLWQVVIKGQAGREGGITHCSRIPEKDCCDKCYKGINVTIIRWKSQQKKILLKLQQKYEPNFTVLIHCHKSILSSSFVNMLHKPLRRCSLFCCMISRVCYSESTLQSRWSVLVLFKPHLPYAKAKKIISSHLLLILKGSR